MWSLIKIVAFIYLTCGCLAANAKVEEYRIWYIPLDRNYYAPVTAETIEGQASQKLTEVYPKIDHLFSEAEKNSIQGLKSGNDFRIKFLCERDGRILFINRDKSVSLDGVIVNIPSDAVQ